MSTCPTCHLVFAGEVQFCPRDGTPLHAPAAADLLVGRILGGRYRLTERLGQGGMGTVYRALHLFMDKPVAIKVLRGELAGDHEAVTRFHREARSASRLDHEHCIRVSDFGQSDDGLLYLVMELLVGESLGDVVRRGSVPPIRAATIGLSVARALAHAHEQGVVHRDLKPDNVFLQTRRQQQIVKVLDFGLAKIADDSHGGHSITRAGVVFGTPEYMAPEQAQSGPIDARTDIYSLGVILYQILTGELPFRAASFLALISKHVNEIPQSLRARSPAAAISPELEAVVLHCLEKDPARRYLTAEALVNDLMPLGERLQSGGYFSRDVAGQPGTKARAATTDKIEPTAATATPSFLTASRYTIPRHRLTRNIIITILGVAVVAGAGALLAPYLARSNSTTTPSSVVSTPSQPSPRALAQDLLKSGDINGAANLIERERITHDDAPLQIMLGDIDLKRGNRLGALAHLHRAASMAPQEAATHVRLAELLTQLGQNETACQEARRALATEPQNVAARTIAENAHCKDKP